MRVPRRAWLTFDRDAELDMQFGIMRTTLEAIVAGNECWYEAGERPGRRTSRRSTRPRESPRTT
jgi:hypothetical protein